MKINKIFGFGTFKEQVFNVRVKIILPIFLKLKIDSLVAKEKINKKSYKNKKAVKIR